MGYECVYTFHPRKEDGSPGYDTEVREEKVVKVGKPFDDTTLEKLAAAVMAQLARRDVWIVDVKIVELVRREVTFKECKDGRGIVLKGRRFTFNEAAQLMSEDYVEMPPGQFQRPAPQCAVPLVEAPGMEMVTIPDGFTPNQPPVPGSLNGRQPHEMLNVQRQQQQIDDLYGNPNKAVPVQRNQTQAVPINPKKVLYEVYFEPYFYEAEVKRMKLKFTPDKKYPVHQIIPHPAGKLDGQKIAVTDDVGRIVQIDEKYFTSAGKGLSMDDQLHFSGSTPRHARKPKLAYENEMYIDPQEAVNRATGQQPQRRPQQQPRRPIPDNIPIDDGTIPEDLMAMPEIRPGRPTQ